PAGQSSRVQEFKGGRVQGWQSSTVKGELTVYRYVCILVGGGRFRTTRIAHACPANAMQAWRPRRNEKCKVQSAKCKVQNEKWIRLTALSRQLHALRF